MKKLLLLCISLLISLASISAEATVMEIYGKVKVKYDGDKKWSRISVLDKLPINATVSTGFNSKIVLDLGNATLDVLPLTRMTIEKISKESDTIATSLFLQGGKIKANVNKIDGKINDFKIKSPVATASVRGTSFEFSGKTLKVIEGIVAYSAKSSKLAKKEVPKDADEKAPEEIIEEVIEKAISVMAGGESQIISKASAPVSTSTMAKKKTSVIASTKPTIIKKVIKESLKGDLPNIPTPSEVQAAQSFTRITVAVDFKE